MHETSWTRRRLLAAGASAGAWAATAAHAQPRGFPTRPISIRVGVPAGGPADNAIRSAAPMLARTLGQPVIVENQPGASGSLAVRTVLAQLPDGHTLLAGPGTDFLMAPRLLASARYQPTAFRLIAVAGLSDFVLLARNGLGGTLESLLARLAQPGGERLSIGHWGSGSAPHFVAGDLLARLGGDAVFIPYKGAAPVLTDIVGGQIDLAFAPLTANVLAMITGGRARAAALATTTRHPLLPGVPALGELPSLQGFDHTVWSGLWAPPDTAAAAVERLNAAFGEWIVSPESVARLASNASRPVSASTTEALARFQGAEFDKFTRLARALGLSPQS